MRILPLLLLCRFAFAEDPWGADCDLTYRAHYCPPPPPQTPIQRLGALLISFHQNVISPADGPRSHFYPSSSQYTKEAMQRYGFVPGFLLGCDRLMRENDDPWLYPTCIGPEGNCLKHDPVP